jgi:hypothetical protein
LGAQAYRVDTRTVTGSLIGHGIIYYSELGQ